MFPVTKFKSFFKIVVIVVLASVFIGAVFVDAAFLVGGVDSINFAFSKYELSQSRKEQSNGSLAMPAIGKSPRLVKAEEELAKKQLALALAADEAKKAEEARAKAEVEARAKATAEAKKKIAANPPLTEASSAGISQATVATSDSKQTTVVSEGTVDQADYNRVAALPNTPNTPYAVAFNDQTGKYAALEAVVKDYLNNTLKWSSEIGALREISVVDDGTVSWNGQYNGSYTRANSGDITDAFGWITLNVNRYKDSTNFNDYMKLVLAHEYGHHYTLYHKWVDADLPVGTRFPDSYYQARPLSKDNTTLDCESSWSSCEPEIIAEDYSYFYSGYNYHAMKDSIGLPSAGTKTWLDNIKDSLVSSEAVVSSPPVAVNAPPALEITSPTDNTQITPIFTFSVDASDDKAVTKVVFYRDDTVLLEDTSVPYDCEVDVSGLDPGTYTFKAVAFDADGASATKSFTLQLTRNPL